MKDDASLLFTRADERQVAARAVLDRLAMRKRLGTLGVPHLVGAMAYDVLVRPDIDLEVTCDVLDIAACFAAMADIAQLPGVRRVRFANAIETPPYPR